MTILQRFNESRISFRHRLARGAIQISTDAIENTVYESPRLRAAVRFCQLDRFIDRNDWWNVIAIKHLVNCQPEHIAIDR